MNSKKEQAIANEMYAELRGNIKAYILGIERLVYWIADKPTCVVRLAVDLDTTFGSVTLNATGVSQCIPSDKYDREYGTDVAWKRASRRLLKKVLTEWKPAGYLLDQNTYVFTRR